LIIALLYGDFSVELQSDALLKEISF